VLSVKLVVAAVVVDMPLMDLLVHLALMDNLEVMDNLASLVMMVNPDPEEHPNKLPTGASTANPDHPDLPGITEELDSQEALASQEIPDKEVDKDHPDLPVHLDQMGTLVTPEGLGSQEALDKFMKFPAQKARPDPQDQTATLVEMDNLEAQEIQVEQEESVLPETLVDLGSPVETDKRDTQVAMVKVVDTVLATTALPHVPLLVIKPKSESNKKIPLNHPKIFSTGNFFLVFFGLFLVKME